MATNDYRSYMRATEEYRHSDTLQHAGKKGMKWGISHTPGYKAIGEKAKGLLNAAGQYIYKTAQAVGNKLTSKSVATHAVASAVKTATKDPAKEARDEAFKERQQRLGQKYVDEYKKKFDKTPNADLLPKPNPIPPGTPKKEEDKPEPKAESHAEVVGKIDAKEGPKEPQKDDLKEDEHGKYRIVDGEKHYDLGDGKEYLYTDGTFFEVGGTGKTVPEGKTPEPAKPGSRVPSDDMVDAEGNLKLIDQYGPYFDADGEKHYDLGDGKAYLYSDGLYFPIGGGEALALVWNDEKFCFEPAEDVRHSETSPHYIGEILDTEDCLEHWGILGMKWGVRRYQNKDGSLTPEGRERYLKGGKQLTEEGRKELGESLNKRYSKAKNRGDQYKLIKTDLLAKEIATGIDEEFEEKMLEHPEDKKILTQFNDKYNADRDVYVSAAAILRAKEKDQADLYDLAQCLGWYDMDDGDQGYNNSKAICASVNGLDGLRVEDAANQASSILDEVTFNSDKKYSSVKENIRRDSLYMNSKAFDSVYTPYEASESTSSKSELNSAMNLAKQISYFIKSPETTASLFTCLDQLGLENKKIDELSDSQWAGLVDYVKDHSPEIKQMDSDQNELYHEGRGHEDGGHSGRYPWGSGKEPYQRNPPAGYEKAKEVLKEVGDQPVSYINKYGVIDVQTVYNNKNPSSIESPAKQNAKKGAVLNEAIVGLDKLTKGDAVGVAKAADNTGKAIENLGRREWTVADFEGIPTEQIQESNRRQAAIETWTKNNGTKTPVEKGKATTAKFLELLGAGIVLYETFKPKEST